MRPTVRLLRLLVPTLLFASSASSQTVADVPALDVNISRTTRLLVVAPHPDDGMLGVGGLMRRVIRLGGKVHVVWTTSGDGFPKGVATSEGLSSGSAHLTPNDFQSYGHLREEEARAALESLGVRSSALTFLGFPDEGLCELASIYLPATAQAFRSPYTGRISPPPTEQIIRGVGYVGADVQRELERVIVSFAPTLIVAPAAQDEHPDHCATQIFLRETLQALARARRPAPHVLHYLIHYGQWPLTDPDGATTLAPPAHFPADGGRWVNLALSPDEVGAKRSALLRYRSQMLVLSSLLASFARSNELFLEGEPASPPSCWCNGQNINVKPLPARESARARRDDR